MDLRDRFYKSREVFSKAKKDLWDFPFDQRYQPIPKETITEIDTLCLALFFYDLTKKEIEFKTKKIVGRAEGFWGGASNCWCQKISFRLY